MFALVPDDGPPRILRFVGSGHFVSTSTVCMLDAATNVLTINRELYDTLTETEQHEVVRTQAPYLAMLRPAA